MNYRPDNNVILPEYLLKLTVLLHQPARVVERYTRTTQNRVPQGLWVRIPPLVQI